MVGRVGEPVWRSKTVSRVVNGEPGRPVRPRPSGSTCHRPLPTGRNDPPAPSQPRSDRDARPVRRGPHHPRSAAILAAARRGCASWLARGRGERLLTTAGREPPAHRGHGRAAARRLSVGPAGDRTSTWHSSAPPRGTPRSSSTARPPAIAADTFMVRRPRRRPPPSVARLLGAWHRAWAWSGGDPASHRSPSAWPGARSPGGCWVARTPFPLLASRRFSAVVAAARSLGGEPPTVLFVLAAS